MKYTLNYETGQDVTMKIGDIEVQGVVSDSQISTYGEPLYYVESSNENKIDSGWKEEFMILSPKTPTEIEFKASINQDVKVVCGDTTLDGFVYSLSKRKNASPRYLICYPTVGNSQWTPESKLKFEEK